MSNGIIWGVDFSAVTLTADIYWLAQPPAVRALRGTQVNAERLNKARELAVAGYTIDAEIHALGQDPLIEMLVRKNQGFTWVPNAMQANIAVMPGLAFPGLPAYDASNPPPGSIKVSLDAADYPPFDPPPPPAPVLAAHIGPDFMFQMAMPSAPSKLCEVFASLATEHFPEGHPYTDSTGTYVYHILGAEMMSPSRRTAVWLKLP